MYADLIAESAGLISAGSSASCTSRVLVVIFILEPYLIFFLFSHLILTMPYIFLILV